MWLLTWIFADLFFLLHSHLARLAVVGPVASVNFLCPCQLLIFCFSIRTSSSDASSLPSCFAAVPSCFHVSLLAMIHFHLFHYFSQRCNTLIHLWSLEIFIYAIDAFFSSLNSMVHNHPQMTLACHPFNITIHYFIGGHGASKTAINLTSRRVLSLLSSAMVGKVKSSELSATSFPICCLIFNIRERASNGRVCYSDDSKIAELHWKIWSASTSSMAVKDTFHLKMLVTPSSIYLDPTSQSNFG